MGKRIPEIESAGTAVSGSPGHGQRYDVARTSRSGTEGKTGQATMPKVRFKAHCIDRLDIGSRLVHSGAQRLARTAATASYFDVPAENAKYYESESYEAGLIGQFQTVSSTPDGTDPTVLREAVFTGDGWTVGIDKVCDHDFVHVEVPYELADGPQSAIAQAESIRELLGIGYLDIVPWPYPQLRNIIRTAQHWRGRTGHLEGRLFLIDGPSAAGKSTLARTLREDDKPGYRYVPRCTSRARRPEDLSDEYVDIDIDTFRTLAHDGQFIDYREFKFKMGYGLRWSDIATTMNSPQTRAAYALVNLGNSRHIQRFVPDATTILVAAPLDQLEQRMRARAAHAPEAIAERLENARRGIEAASMSDHVIENANGRLDDSLRTIRKLIYG